MTNFIKKSLLTAANQVLVILAINLLSVVSLRGQPANIVRVKNGKDATKSISVNDRFQFKSFQNGKLVYTNGKFAQAKLNYCYVMGEVMFIDFKGDTLLIADNNLVDRVEIGKSVFHPDSQNGYQEILDTTSNIVLARRIQYKIGGTEKKGAYGNNNDQGTISNAGNFTDVNTGQNVVLPVNNNVVLMRPITFYFLIDNNNRTYKANKGGFLKVFSKNKSLVEKYLYEENIDFNSEKDLKKAIAYFVNLEPVKI